MPRGRKPKDTAPKAKTSTEEVKATQENPSDTVSGQDVTAIVPDSRKELMHVRHITTEIVKVPAKRGRKKKTDPVKTVAENTSSKPRTRKAVKEPETTAEMTIQFSGKSYSTADLVKIARDVWKYDLGKEEADFRSVELYVVPEENTVYYVINGTVKGNFAI